MEQKTGVFTGIENVKNVKSVASKFKQNNNSTISIMLQITVRLKDGSRYKAFRTVRLSRA